MDQQANGTAVQMELDGIELSVDDLLRDLPADTRGKELLKRGLSYLHEALADWMLINPGGTLRDMGNHFGYSAPWLCRVINTDMFQAYMHARRDEVCSQVAQSLPQKLEAAAHLATERIIEVIEKTEDSETLIDAFDKVMHRYGYAPNAKNGAQAAGAVINQQNNVFYLTREDLAKAREKLVESHEQLALPAP